MSDFYYFGCESGDDSILRTVTKGITTSQIESTVKMALEIGFCVTCSFVINLPFETPQRARRTIAFAKKLKAYGRPDSGAHVATIPGNGDIQQPREIQSSSKHQGIELWKVMSHPLYLEDRPPTPIVFNSLISEQELVKLWSDVTSTFDYY